MVCLCFFFNMTGFYALPAFAESDYLDSLPNPGDRVEISSSYLPASLKGIHIYPDNPLMFDFFLEKGEKSFSDQELAEESQKLVKYFLASLTVPEEEMWVNLSPYEEDRIIPEKFSWTEMGRDLLGQDYILKEITSSLMYPEEDLGSEFWDSLYSRIYDEMGTVDIPLDTLNKVWIVPEKAEIFVNEETNSVFVLDRKLKVMMEEEYLAKEAEKIGQRSVVSVQGNSDDQRTLVANTIKEIVIPVLEKEVNEGAHFAKLRQIYDAMILATWFKRNLKDNLVKKIYADRNKVAGIDLTDKKVKDKIYDYYLKAYQQGVFNYVKDEYDPVSQNIIPRKYFSGGVKFSLADHALAVVTDKKKSLSLLQTAFLTITIGLLSAGAAQGMVELDLKDDPFVFDARPQDELEISEVLKSLQIQGKSVDVNSFYDELRRLEKDYPREIALSAPAPSVKLVSSPAQLVTPLKTFIESALKKDEKNREIYQKALDLIAENLRVRGDMPLGDLGYLLRDLDTEQGQEAGKVLSAFEGMSRIYQYNEFDPSRPTVLLMHGAGRGDFNSFGNSIEQLKDKANIIYYQYNYLDPLDVNTERFYSNLKEFTKMHATMQPLLVLAYSNGGTTFRNAVLNYEDEMWANTHLVRIAEPLAGTGKSLLSVTFPGAKLGTKIFSGRYKHLTYAHLPNSDVQKYLASPENDLRFRNALGSITTVIAKGDSHVLPFEKSTMNPFFNAVLSRARIAYGVSYGFSKVTPQEFESMPITEALKTYIEVDTKSDNPHSVISEDPQTVGIIDYVFNRLDTLNSRNFQEEYKSLFGDDALDSSEDYAMSVNSNEIGITQKFEQFPSLKAYPHQKEFLDLISAARDRKDPLNVLFVCKGNIYRSRLMHLLFEQAIQDMGISNINVSSAGTEAWAATSNSPLYSVGVLSLLLKGAGYQTASDMYGTLDEELIFALLREDMSFLNTSEFEPSEVRITDANLMNLVKLMNSKGDLVPELENLHFDNETLKQQYIESLKRWQDAISVFFQSLRTVSMYRTRGDEVDKVARKMGVSEENLLSFISNALTKDMVEEATVVVTIDEENVKLVEEGFHTAKGKTFLFNALAPAAFKQKDHVPDPDEREISVKKLALSLSKSFAEELLPNMLVAFAQDKDDVIMNDVLAGLQNAGFASLRDVVKKTISAKKYIHKGDNSRALLVPGAEDAVLLDSLRRQYLPLFGTATFTLSKLHHRNMAIPVMEIGSYKLVKFLTGPINGIDWKDQNQRSPEIDARYIESLEQVSEQMTQAAYDEFAENLKLLYEEGYRFDAFNPNNLLLDGDHFNIVDLERNHMKEKPSLNMMVAPLINVFHINNVSRQGDEDILFDTRAKDLRQEVLKKAAQAALKYDLQIPEVDDRTMTLAFEQAGMKGQWPDFRENLVQARDAKGKDAQEEDYAVSVQNKDVQNATNPSAVNTEWKKGGIDLNAANLKIEAQGGNIQMNLPEIYNEDTLMNIPGFIPVIMDIVPTVNMPLLLGVNTSPPSDALLTSVTK